MNSAPLGLALVLLSTRQRSWRGLDDRPRELCRPVTGKVVERVNLFFSLPPRSLVLSSSLAPPGTAPLFLRHLPLLPEWLAPTATPRLCDHASLPPPPFPPPLDPGAHQRCGPASAPIRRRVARPSSRAPTAAARSPSSSSSPTGGGRPKTWRTRQDRSMAAAARAQSMAVAAGARPMQAAARARSTDKPHAPPHAF